MSREVSAKQIPSWPGASQRLCDLHASGTGMYLENCIYEIIQKNVKRLEIGKETSEELSFKDNESKQ